jgi:hypothetical protein
MMYLVVDSVTRNVLGECESLASARALFVDLVAHQPEAYRDIHILSEAGEKQDVPHEDVVAALEAVVS